MDRILEDLADRPGLLLDFGEGPRRAQLLMDPDAKELVQRVDVVDEDLATRLGSAMLRSEPYSLHDRVERATIVAALKSTEPLSDALDDVLQTLRG